MRATARAFLFSSAVAASTILCSDAQAKTLCVEHGTLTNTTNLEKTWAREREIRLPNLPRQCRNANVDDFDTYLEVVFACALQDALHGVLGFESAAVARSSGRPCTAPLRFDLEGDRQFPRLGSLRVTLHFDGSRLAGQYLHRGVKEKKNERKLGIAFLFQDLVADFFREQAINGALSLITDKIWSSEQTEDNGVAWLKLESGRWPYGISAKTTPVILEVGFKDVPVCASAARGKQVAGPVRTRPASSTCPTRPLGRPKTSATWQSGRFSIRIVRN